MTDTPRFGLRPRDERPLVMGVVNVTPDSFSDGGSYLDPDQAVAHALQLVEEGADILDIGGESTRPGADDVSVDEECARVLPVIERLIGKTDRPISIDTRKAAVMRAAVAAGARLINDVSALSYDVGALAAAAAADVPVVLMHAQGAPKTMQDAPAYDDVVAEIAAYLEGRAEAAMDAGLRRDNIILDPGVGFGKTLGHNLSLMKHLGRIRELGYPLLLGASRKSFIGKIDGSAVDARLGGSLAAALWGAANGADIVRVHDVAETVQALAVWRGVAEAG